MKKKLLIFSLAIALGISIPSCYMLKGEVLKASAIETKLATIKSPATGNRITESYILRFTIPTTIKPEGIVVSYMGTNDVKKKVDVVPNTTGTYEVLIDSIKTGNNTISVNVKRSGTNNITSVPVIVEKAETIIALEEAKTGPYSENKNQFKNMLKDRNAIAAKSLNKAPKSDEYINYFVDILFEEAIKENVRPDVVFSQIMLETGWLTFGGDVNETQNNFGGIGATGGGVMGNAFDNIKEGIIVNVQHLVAYSSTNELNGELLDPRFKYLTTKRGLTPSVETLGYFENTNNVGWAYSPQYGFKIKDALKVLQGYNNNPFVVAPTKDYSIDLKLFYVNIDGISTSINQGTAPIGSDLRASIATNGYVETRFIITDSNGQVIKETPYSLDTSVNFTVANSGIYRVLAEVRPVGKTDVVKSLVKTFSIDSTIVEKTQNTIPTTGQYILNNSVNVYGNAADALNLRNPIRKYEAGGYYVYKSFDGMLNISKTSGIAGGWINPAENKEVTNVNSSNTLPEITTTTTEGSSTSVTTTLNLENLKLGDEINLTNAVSVYNTAADASKKINSVSTYKAGTYYLYKTYNGILNISRVKGQAGAWVNPKDIVVTVTPDTTTIPVTTSPETTSPETTAATTTTQTNTTTPTTVTTTQGNLTTPITKVATDLASLPLGTKIELAEKVNIYSNAQDAQRRINPIRTYEPGTYYIYKVYNGIVNITKISGRAGGWVNPNDVVLKSSSNSTNTQTTVTTNTTQATTQATTTKAITEATTQGSLVVGNLSQGSKIDLAQAIKIYANANNAKNRISPVTSYGPGTYYVYKIYNGIINISKVKGVPGGWVNPGDIVLKTNNTTVTNTTLPSQTTTAKTTAASTNATTTSTQGQINTQTSGLEKLSAGTKFTLITRTPVYSNAIDAKNKVNPLKYYEAGVYYIFRSYNGMVNITKNKGLAGAWINPQSISYSLEGVNPIVTQPITQPSTQVSQTPLVGKPYTLTKVTAKYMNSEDALANRNILGYYSSGLYYVYKINGSTINISRTPGIPGAWINITEPQIATQNISTFSAISIDSNVVSTTIATTSANTPETYEVKVASNMYGSSQDAVDLKNPVGKFELGNYYVFSKSGDVINISKEIDKEGYWINPNEANNQVEMNSSNSLANLVSTTDSAKLVVNTITTESTQAVGDIYELIKEINVYTTADDAKKLINPVKKYQAGKYYIFKEFNGMINISQFPGGAGAWINPIENK